MNFKKKIKGFTLIELLLVISIIALLSSIVLSSVQEARDNAIIAAFNESVRQSVIDLNIIRDENGGDFPFEVLGNSYQFPIAPFEGGTYENAIYLWKNDAGTIQCGNETPDYMLRLTYNFQFSAPSSYKYNKLFNFGWKKDSEFDAPCYPL